MWRIALLSALLAGSLSAQMRIGISRLPPGLISYLELTQSQQDQIVTANESLTRFQGQKVLRTAVVQAEIQAELRKADPDAMALGVRYRELEAIRRENAAEQDRTLQTVQAALTAAQKQKLTTLQEALRLQSTACDAVNWNLIMLSPVPPYTVPANVLQPVNGMPGSLLPGSVGNGCGTRWMETGDFTFMPGLPGRVPAP